MIFNVIFEKNIMNRSLLTYLLTFCFVLINNIFLYKYGYRILEIKIVFVNILYTLFLSVLLYSNIIERFAKRNLYFLISVLSIFLSLIITLIIDGNSLNSDRWSAMTVAIEAIFNNEYPYTATDHLNGRTSNFPGLILIGMPFYFFGNVGLLQVFALVLLSYTLYTTLSLKRAFTYLVLFLTSIAFWYEVASLSDFMSNVILVFCFIMLWNKNNSKSKYNKPVLLAIVLSILLLTRGIVFVPLVLYFFADFFRNNLKNQIVFLLTFLSSCALMIYMVLKDCPDSETLLKFNPLVLQTSYTPQWFNFTMIVVPIVFSFFIKNFHQFLVASISINLFIIGYYFVQSISLFGIHEAIHNSKIDVVYLSFMLPFLCLYFVISNSKSPSESPQSIF